jgi:PAS domain S-box-containing protein
MVAPEDRLPGNGGTGEELTPTQEQLTQELLEQQRLLREAQSIAHVGSWHWVVGENRVHWSDELYRIYGLEPGSVHLSLESFLQRVHEDDRCNTRAKVQHALASGEPFDFEERIVRPDGSIRLLRSRGSVDRSADGAPRRLIGVCQDITEQRAAEQAALELARESAARTAAQAAEARMSLLAEASAELASSLDYETTLRTVARLMVPSVADWSAVDILDGGSLRRLATEHSDRARVELVSRIQERYPPDPDSPHGAWAVVRTRRTQLVEEIPDSLIEAAAQDAEHLRIIRELGLRSYVCVPLVSRDAVLGAITLVYAESGRRYTAADLPFIEDLARRAATAIENAQLVSQLREAQDRLQEQAQELELQTEELETQNLELQHQAAELRRVSGAKSDFMATVSHELRTPLNAIIGYSELLSAGIPDPIAEGARHQVERIQLGAHHLLQLIEEILTFSSLEAGGQQARVQRVELGGLLAELHAITEPLAQRRGLAFAIRPKRVPSELQTDATKLRQVLLNLLSNAVKFTDHGSVELEVDSDDGAVWFVVRDTGIGVEAADLTLLFEPFWQADQSLTRKAQGAGLGLAIAQRFVGLLGGEIVVRSTPGEGSEFRVRLPLVLTPAPAGKFDASPDDY